MGWEWIRRLFASRRPEPSAAARPGTPANDNAAIRENWNGEDLIRLLDTGAPVDDATMRRIAQGLGQIDPDQKS
jgi:hypothetical protein